MKTSRKVVAYCRFSPRPDPADTMTLAVQQESCERYASMKGLVISEVLQDPETSAYKTRLQDRPSGSRLVELCRQGQVSDVIVARLDRIFRRVSDGSSMSDEWKSQGIALHLADEGCVSLSPGTAIGEVMFNIMLSFNQFAPHLTSERTSGAMRHMASQGKRVGRHAQYGWRLVDGQMHSDLDEQKVIKMILQGVEQGVFAENIAESLNQVGVLYRGRWWKTRDVESIIRRHTTRSS